MDTCLVLSYFCACDGKTTLEGVCGHSFAPYSYPGACRVEDGGADEACRMELSTFTCHPDDREGWCCPPKFDGTVAGAPACAYAFGTEVQTAGPCGSRRALRRAWSALSIACTYATDTGELVGARKVSEQGRQFCGQSRTAVGGETSSCDLERLARLRSCTDGGT